MNPSPSPVPIPPRARLRSFEVENFRLFRKEKLELEDDVTILVGLNDTGKSTLLNALSRYETIIHESGFREPLSGAEASGQDAGPTAFAAEWVVGEQTWHHRLVFDPSRPEEILRSGEAFWSWNPKSRVLTTNEGRREAKELQRFVSLASIAPTRWQLDSDVPETVWRPLEVLELFRAPQPYLFEPGTLAMMTPLDLEMAHRSGFGWAVWLQEIINRRNDDLPQLESAIRGIFPFFGRVLVREHRARVVREVLDTSPRQPESKPRRKWSNASPMESELARVAAEESRREILFELPAAGGGSTDGEPPIAVPAENVSSGLLLALAHLALVMTTEEGGLIALEEPENGLNTRVMLDMMRAFLGMIRKRGQQVILASHNGWWLDLLPPRAFRVLTRDEAGGHVHRPSEEALGRFLQEQGLYASEIFGTFGPEGLLRGGESR